MGLRRLSLAVLLALACAGLAPVAAPAQEAGTATSSDSGSGTVEAAAVTAPSIFVIGSGYGHGVGMSQYGAYAQAQAGRTAADIISYYYQGASVVTVPDLGGVGVGILQSSGTVTLKPLGKPGGGAGALLHQGGQDGPVVGSCPVDATCVISTSNGQMSVSGITTTVTGDRANPIFVGVTQASGDVYVQVEEAGHTYSHGSIEVLPTAADANSLNAVDFMDLDVDYVAGIAEVPSSWPAAALDAQAIAARTYAWQRHRGGSCDCDLRDDTFDQVYGGWEKESQSAWAAAAARTAGMVIEYDGSKISALYSSSSGGRTEANEDAFGTAPVAYLRSIDDPWSLTSANPYRSWERRFGSAEAAVDFGFDRVFGLSVTERTQGGSVAKAIVSGVRAGRSVALTLTGAQLRFDLALPSTHADVPAPNFDEYLSLFNPNDHAVQADLSLLFPKGDPPLDVSVTLPAGTRQTVHVNDLAPFRDVSVAVHSSAPIVAERPMYFTYLGTWSGGHVSEGVPAPGNRWLLAEGYVASNFDTYVLVANPGPLTTTAHVRLFGPGGDLGTFDLTLPAHTRNTLKLNDVVPQGDVSAEVTADQPVVAERSEYFDYSGLDGRQSITGGHNAPGVAAPSTTWYLAEGYTADAFDTFLLLENPGASEAHAHVTFLRPSGDPVEQTITVPAASRTTVVVDRVPGLEATEVSTKVESDQPIVAEHSIYFDYQGRVDGNDAEGVTAAQDTWYLAEGYASPTFDTYVLVANPSTTEAAEVTLDYHQNAGLGGSRSITVPAGARRTVKVNDDVSGDVATVVRSTNGVPVVAERSMFFDYNGRKGGSDAVAVATPSTDWFFAEGYTGS